MTNAMITGPAKTIQRARKLRQEMTLPEVKLWGVLRSRPGGFKFRRQHPAGVYVLDFYCAAARLAIEVDGWAHALGGVAKADAARSAHLRSQRVATLRVPAKVVLDDLAAAVTRIVEVCQQRTSSPAGEGTMQSMVEWHRRVLRAVRGRAEALADKVGSTRLCPSTTAWVPSPEGEEALRPCPESGSVTL